MNVKDARILHISKYYYPFVGGTEQVARNVVRAFIGTGAEQKVICFNENASDGTMSCKRSETVTELVDGVEIVRCGTVLKLASQSISTTYRRELNRAFENFRPNLVVLHYPNPFATKLLLENKDREFKLLVYWHLDITRQKVLKYLVYNQNLELIQRADRILGATPKHVDESFFTPCFGDKRTILPYMIDTDNLVLSREEVEYGKHIREKFAGEILCFFIGRHVPYKGLTYLIKAAKELKDTKIRFLIAGKGELTESLKAEAKDTDRVVFLGKISDAKKRAFQYASHIICMPSITRNEGFGLALAEGMYFGHPAVTFTIPGSGINYLNLDGVTGIECPNSDYMAYASAVRKLAYDDKLREKMGKAAQERVKKMCLPENFRQAWFDLVEEL